MCPCCPCSSSSIDFTADCSGVGTHSNLCVSVRCCWCIQVFLRGGQMAVLDTMRTDIMHKAAVTIQRHARGFVVRRQTHRTRRAVIKLQVPTCSCIHAPCCLLLHHHAVLCCPLCIRLNLNRCCTIVSCSGLSHKAAMLSYRLSDMLMLSLLRCDAAALLLACPFYLCCPATHCSLLQSGWGAAHG